MNKYLTILIVAVFLCTRDCGALSNCNQDVELSYVNGDMYMMAKSKISFPSKPKDCAELYLLGHHQSGTYTVWPANRLFENLSIRVYCDMETSGGGWTVIQRRGNFNNPADYFYRGWDMYKLGFGEKTKEFWLGNDIIYALTNQKLYSARFDLTDVQKKTAFAEYDTFWIDDENSLYKLHIDGYKGTAGDSLAFYHNNQKFSTIDQDNDSHAATNCAQVFQGAWWFNACHKSNLNGLNMRGKQEKKGKGINWKTWGGFEESLDSVEIKIRPKDFKLLLLSYGNSP